MREKQLGKVWDSGNSAPKMDAGSKLQVPQHKPLRNLKEVKGGQPILKEAGWETRERIQMDQILIWTLQRVTGGKRPCSPSLVQNSFSYYIHVTEIGIWLAICKGYYTDSIFYCNVKP